MDWKIFLRQLLMSSGVWTLYFMDGLTIGLPTVLVPQLRRANQTVSDEEASWISATLGYGGIPWLVIQSVVTFNVGRRKTYVFVCISGVIGFITILLSKNITHVLIGEFFQGALSAGNYTTSTIILIESVSSQYRGFFLTIKSATLFWGILVANAIGTYFHWQNIPILGLVCGAYALIGVTVWPESPLWLASKGKFEECAAAHRWLKGEDEESEKELEKMLKLHENRRFVKQKWVMRNVLKTIRSKQLAKPILLCSLLIFLHCSSGKLVCTVYAIDVLKKITNSEAAAYSGMLILDGATVFSMYLGCILSRVIKRRAMYLGFSITGITFMVLTAVYLYLAKLLVIDENKYFSIFLLAGYSIAIGCGPMILSGTITGELLPIKFRTLTIFFIALTFKITYGTFLKVSPFCFKTLGIHGTFTLYGVLSIIFVVLIYLYLPETKEKTIEEINECLRRRNNETLDDAELINTIP